MKLKKDGQLLRWMRQLGYNTGIKTRRPNIVSNLYSMAQKRIKSDNPDSYREVKVGDESLKTCN
ncbi:MAG: hypothetical protein IPJ93_13690 [Bacteroidota bacterium]|nr:MAG: hypothetical protein IPJ93_13690 [Bacteroidota bacterium]